MKKAKKVFGATEDFCAICRVQEGRISTTPVQIGFHDPVDMSLFAGNPFKPNSNKVQTLNPPSKS
jgi:hypothetical protein